jgi:hypothetical protein
MLSEISNTLGKPSEKDHDNQHIIADFTDIEVFGRPGPIEPKSADRETGRVYFGGRRVHDSVHPSTLHGELWNLPFYAPSTVMDNLS